MLLLYPEPLACGESTIMPMGRSPPSLSSQVMNSAPPFWYAAELRMAGTACESQVSPFFTESVVAQPVELCMSSHRLGVMKLYAATVFLERSLASSEYGRTCAMHRAAEALLVLVTSSKKTKA